MTSQLIGADFAGGAQLPNYVNGRLLTAEDLATGQATLRERDARIGRAAGAGVVTGLWVSAAAASLTVQPGLALTRAGHPLKVGHAVTLPLAVPATGTAPSAATFACCPTAGGSDASIGAGNYLLTARPVSRLTGQAALSGPPGSDAPAGCTAQWTEDGVRFAVVALPEPTTVAGVPVTAGNRRNLLAHWCFGTQQLAAVGVDPFHVDPAYAGPDGLAPADLGPCDVPLAVFRWNGQTVSDLDHWSVRRRVTHPDPADGPWSVQVGDRRAADGQARMLQFQDQTAAIVGSGGAPGTVAAEKFGLLPPVGFLPVLPQLWQKLVAAQPLVVGLAPNLAELPGGAGFDAARFFAGLARFGGILDWDVVDLAVQQSFRRAPVPTTPPQQQPENATPPLTVYLVAQNVQAIVAAQASGAPPPGLYIVFVACYRVLPNTLPPVVGREQR